MLGTCAVHLIHASLVWFELVMMSTILPIALWPEIRPNLDESLIVRETKLEASKHCPDCQTWDQSLWEKALFPAHAHPTPLTTINQSWESHYIQQIWEGCPETEVARKCLSVRAVHLSELFPTPQPEPHIQCIQQVVRFSEAEKFGEFRVWA